MNRSFKPFFLALSLSETGRRKCRAALSVNPQKSEFRKKSKTTNTHLVLYLEKNVKRTSLLESLMKKFGTKHVEVIVAAEGTKAFDENCYFNATSPNQKPLLTYPLDEPGAILIYNKDLTFLDDEEFVNDTILDFYLKYIRRALLTSKQRRRIFFFNTFFFTRLDQLGRKSTFCFSQAFHSFKLFFLC